MILMRAKPFVSPESNLLQDELWVLNWNGKWGSLLTFDPGARLTPARPVTQRHARPGLESPAVASHPLRPTQPRHLDSFGSQLSRTLGPARLIRRFSAA